MSVDIKPTRAQYVLGGISILSFIVGSIICTGGEATNDNSGVYYFLNDMFMINVVIGPLMFVGVIIESTNKRFRNAFELLSVMMLETLLMFVLSCYVVVYEVGWGFIFFSTLPQYCNIYIELRKEEGGERGATYGI